VVDNYHDDDCRIWRLFPKDFFWSDNWRDLGCLGNFCSIVDGRRLDQHAKHGSERKKGSNRFKQTLGKESVKGFRSISNHPQLQEISPQEENRSKLKGSTERRVKEPTIEHFLQTLNKLPTSSSSDSINVLNRRCLRVNEQAIWVHQWLSELFDQQPAGYNWKPKELFGKRRQSQKMRSF